MRRFRFRAFTCVIVAGMFIGAVAAAQRSNPEAKKLKNPVASSPESIEAGRKTYVRYCLGCHGPSGKGDGSMALAGGTPSNLVDETWDYGS
ncbi:MAG TPA: c-type cytochrome, partial [Blastocatellia bacterium]|nr:c-type cytochrome [Blastocatellia bacterium]